MNIHSMPNNILKIIIATTIVSLVVHGEDEFNSSNNDDYSDDSDTSLDVPIVCDPPCTGGLHDQCQACTTHCPPSCDRKSMPCLESCGPIGCQCQMGYVRGPNDNCILPEECPNAERRIRQRFKS